MNDSRSCCVTRNEVVSDLDADTATIAYNTPEVPGGTGQYIIGEGYADSNGTISVTLTGGSQSQQLNAFQLRSPSPFPPYILPVQLSPSNFVYAGTALGLTGGAVSPVGAITTYQWQWKQRFRQLLCQFYRGRIDWPPPRSTSTPTGFATGDYLFQPSSCRGERLWHEYFQIGKTAVHIEALAAPVAYPAFGPTSATLYADSAPITIGGTVNGSTPLTFASGCFDNGIPSSAFSHL